MYKLLSLAIVIMLATVSLSAQTANDHRPSIATKSVNNTVRAVAMTTEPDAAIVRETSYSYPADDFKPGVVQVGPRTTYLKEGLRINEVVRLLGRPSAISERNDAGVKVTVYEFPRSEGRVLIAEFENGLLVRSTTESRVNVARSDR